MVAAGVLMFGVVVGYFNGVAVIHEACHAVAALLSGDTNVAIAWDYALVDKTTPFVFYAGFFGNVLIFGTLATVVGATGHPLLGAWCTGVVVSDMIYAPTSMDWQHTRRMLGDFAHEQVAALFLVLCVVALAFGVTAYIVGVLRKTERVDSRGAKRYT